MNQDLLYHPVSILISVLNSGLTTRILCAFFISTKRAACPDCLTFFNVKELIIFSQVSLNLQSSSIHIGIVIHAKEFRVLIAVFTSHIKLFIDKLFLKTFKILFKLYIYYGLYSIG
jgi:hypothetical protein